jgi:hypothetical protein
MTSSSAISYFLDVSALSKPILRSRLYIIVNASLVAQETVGTVIFHDLTASHAYLGYIDGRFDWSITVGGEQSPTLC